MPLKKLENYSPMTKTLICYKSKYGSTKQYAEMIRDALGVDLADINKSENIDFSKYDVIIFGGYYHMGKINTAQIIKHNWDTLKSKKLVLFTTSGLPAEHPRIKKIYENCFPENIRERIKYFPLKGRLRFQKLTVFDKSLIFIASKFEKDMEIKKGMQTFDGVRQENLTHLLDYLKKNANI